ncbi:DNA internalization-related competence protein ComEC/Rec2 [Halalkalibacter krulwichiae]|uniref:DNA internalization-related competence protein ComEC/Rec2 n=1 Tax=Halalkalibacter krulwichiae TaxID=199441 RepID=UPI000A19BAD1|nr:DNA internalization-related competence protein ComEC/Rec2 [Halalkalibacter krulwichiae]
MYFGILITFLIFCFTHRTFFKEKVLLVTIPFVLYYLIGLNAVEQNQTSYEEGSQNVYGVIQTIPTIDGDSMSMRLKSNTGEMIQVQSFIYHQEDQLKMKTLAPGDACMITGDLSKPLPPTNFSQFNYKQYLLNHNIIWILRPEQGGIACIQGRAELLNLFQRFRQKHMMRIVDEVDPSFSGIMNALVFGDRNNLDGDLLKAYQHLGIIHLLAVSGLHVGMLVSILFYVLIRFGLARERAMEIMIVILPVYIIFAGAAPSVIRASIMAMVVLLSMRFRKKLSPIAGISLVYLGYLAINPLTLFHLGFQLSFLISFGLIISAPTIIQKYQHPISQLIVITFLAQLLSFPLILYHTFEFSLLSLPLNLVYIPVITTVVLPLTLLAFLLSFFLPAGINLPLLVLELVYSTFHPLLLEVSDWSLATIVFGRPSVIFVAAFYGVILIGCIKWENGTRNWWVAPVTIFGLLCFWQLSSPYFNPEAKVTVIDVGQGDSILIELPFRRAVYLIDAGGTVSFTNEDWRNKRKPFDVGADIVIPTLTERGIKKLDKLVLTHGHLDHIGGAMALVDAIKVKEVLYGKGPVEGEFERDLLLRFIEKGTQIHFVEDGMSWSKGRPIFQSFPQKDKNMI